MVCRLRSGTTELFLSHFSCGRRHRCHPLRNPLCNFLSETKAARSPSEVMQNTCMKCSSIWASSKWNKCQLSQGVPEGEAVLRISEHGWSIYFKTEVPSEWLRWRIWFLAGKCQTVDIRHVCGCGREKGEVRWTGESCDIREGQDLGQVLASLFIMPGLLSSALGTSFVLPWCHMNVTSEQSMMLVTGLFQEHKLWRQMWMHRNLHMKKS